ncbi:MAG: hypothetical protein HQK54_06790 [Oligoflexales bacterium]|nr:hypothetical protein [Oligoflexales bacterium]
MNLTSRKLKIFWSILIMPLFLISTDIYSRTITLDRSEFVSDGQPIQITPFNIHITPPNGWEIKRNVNGMSLIMQVPSTLKRYDSVVEPYYQRNISVSILRTPSPIDIQSVNMIKKRVQEGYKVMGVNEYTIANEYNFFDFKKKNDGLVFYSYLSYKGVQLAQMHMLLSGKDKSVLMTYTDLTNRFANNKDMYNEAWNAMTSLKIPGTAPTRNGKVIVNILLGVLVVMILLATQLMRILIAKTRINNLELSGKEEANVSDGKNKNIGQDKSIFNDDIESSQAMLISDSSAIGEDIESNFDADHETSLHTEDTVLIKENVSVDEESKEVSEKFENIS